MSTLHVQMSSGEAFDSPAQATEDFETNLRRGADATVVTEVTAKGHRPELLAVAKRHGLHVHGGIGDTCIVTPHRIVNQGLPKAHDGGRDSSGVYAARDVPWLTIDWHDEMVTLIGAHWVRPTTPERVKRHNATTDLVCRLATTHSYGRSLAFILGDLNEDDDKGTRGRAASRLAAAGIATIYDELLTYPATGPGGGTIDLIASVNADTRVQAVGVFAHPLGNSDHAAVSGFYSVGAR